MEQRPFRHSDPAALQLSGTMHKLFVEKQADFVTVDSAFGGTFATDWKAALDACFDHPTHEAMTDRLEGHTDALTAAMGQGVAAVRDLRYYVQSAFGQQPLARAFGLHQHDRARRVPSIYANYLRVQHAMALRHAAALDAKGMTPAHMAALDAAATAIHQTEVAQELFKRDILEATATRIALYATMWAYPQKVNAAADVVFASDPIKRALFNLG